jgi:hypothetical protein
MPSLDEIRNGKASYALGYSTAYMLTVAEHFGD